jgi:hypothetical protein
MYNAVTEHFRRNGRILKAEGFHLNKKKSQMIGILQFEALRGEDPMTPFTVLIVNSYDKKVRAKIAAGMSVFYCTNMCVSGDAFTISHKHTRFVWEALMSMMDKVSIGAEREYRKQVQFRSDLGQRPITDDQGYEILGLMRGRRILKPRMYQTALEQWQSPDFEAFEDRNLWSLYNAATFGVKKYNPGKIVEHNPLIHNHFAHIVG